MGSGESIGRLEVPISVRLGERSLRVREVRGLVPGSIIELPQRAEDELTLVVNWLRIMPLHERHVLICTKRGEEWVLARIPAARGVPVEVFEDQVFTDYRKADWEVFKRRWKTVTGHEIS
mgnify:CR=1 FL=1